MDIIRDTLFFIMIIYDLYLYDVVLTTTAEH